MATVSKEIAEKIVANEGHYLDDQQVKQVVRYTNMAGEDAYAILYAHDVRNMRYAPSPYVRDPIVIWRAREKHA